MPIPVRTPVRMSPLWPSNTSLARLNCNFISATMTGKGSVARCSTAEAIAVSSAATTVQVDGKGMRVEVA